MKIIREKLKKLVIDPVLNLIGTWTLENENKRLKTLLEEKIKQVPIDKEQFFILEEILKSIERIEKEQENSRFNYVNIENLTKNMDGVLEDIELLKDKIRENGKYNQ